MQAAISGPESYPFVLIGNKSDQEDRRAVTRRPAESWCGEAIPYFETSARDGEMVDEAFAKAAKLALSRIPDSAPIKIPDVNIQEVKPTSRGCCG